MEVSDFIRINDWNFKKLLIIILSLQFSIIGITFFNSVGIKIPLVGEILSLIFILYIPGILILRILQLHELEISETVLYSIGLSISTLMIIGLFINFIYPVFDLKPFSTFNIFATIIGFTNMLIVLAYLRDSEYQPLPKIEFRNISPVFLLALLLPFIAIIGTFVVNYLDNNLILIILLLLMAFIVILFAFNKIPTSIFAFTIFTMSLALLYHNSLISNYIWGADIHREFYFANLVIENGLWNSKINNNYNAMISITNLAPLLSLFSGISLTYIFKVVYPFIFSLVPVGLYKIFEKQTTPKISFLGTFFFISLFVFFTEMLALARQEIAELFLVLILLIIVNEKINGMKMHLLMIIFGFSLIVSHYGLSYLFISFLIPFLFYIVFERFNNKSESLYFSTTFIILLIVFTLTWYIYVSQASIFESLVNIGNQITGSISTDLFNTQSVQGLNLAQEKLSPLHQISKYLHFLTQGLILIGFFAVIFKRAYNFTTEFKILLISSLGLLILSLAVPYLSSALNTTRVYQISLIFLAPLCIIGVITLFNFLKYKISFFNKIWSNPIKITSIILVVFFLFNTGLIYELTNDNPISISISQKSAENSKNIEKRIDFYLILNQFEYDQYNAIWIKKYKANNSIISDYMGRDSISSYLNSYHMSNLAQMEKVDKNTLLFLSYSNLKGDLTFFKGAYPINKISKLLNRSNKIYDNSGSQTYSG